MASFTEISRNYNQEPTVQSQTGSNLINQFLCYIYAINPQVDLKG